MGACGLAPLPLAVLLHQMQSYRLRWIEDGDLFLVYL